VSRQAIATSKENGDSSVAKATIDDLIRSGAGHDAGDILSDLYTLTAEARTGAGQGCLAFVGDPFDLAASGGGFEVTAIAAAVPEPESRILGLPALVLISTQRWRVTRSARLS